MKVILLGATGRIGAATLNALHAHPEVSSVVAITRRPLLLEQSKFSNVIHTDFTTWPDSLLETEMAGAVACIWAMGIRPSLVKSYEQAYAIEVKAPISAARAFARILAPQLVNGSKFRFIYVSGAASETDPKRRLWFAGDARKLKGETEVEIERVNKEEAECFEGYITKTGLVTAETGGIAAGMAIFMPSFAITESELAMAMVDIALKGGENNVFTNAELVKRGQEALDSILK